MTRQEAIEEACKIIGLAYHSIGDYTFACDGFCDKCQAARREKVGYPFSLGDYRNGGQVFDYVRQAVLEKLTKDGIKVADGFDSVTGEEVKG